MQLDTDDGWVEAAAFATVNATGSSKKLNVPQLLKYIRWEVTGLTGTGTPAITFMISGMLRNN